MDALTSGTLAGTGSFRCDDCGYTVSLTTEDALPSCPSCGGTTFSRASLFAPTVDATTHVDENHEQGAWLDDARGQLSGAGQYVAFLDGERTVIVPLTREWTRVGRSLAADVRFDDPTVSRRHALIVRQPDGVRVLDDRSLNGVFVNGERVEWSVLRDGDEIIVGRHVLRFLDVAGEATPTDDGAPSGAQTAA